MIKLLLTLRTLNDRPGLLAFLSVATIIISLCLAFNPVWQTNDDAVMSMIAHGYGLAEYGSPNLVFSNVLWGYVVRAIPSINGVLGYSLATMATLLLFGWATLYFLVRLDVDYFLSLFAVALLLVMSTLFPQFTINAGLLTVAAVVGWHVYAQTTEKSLLIISCLLAFFGFLIRYEEFLLVLGVALPLLPWRTLQKQRTMQIAFLLLSVAITSAAVFDRWSYSGPEWQNFKELNTVRIPFTDYGVGENPDKYSQLLEGHNYTPNDISLISKWFFVDTHLADAKSLNALLSALSAFPVQDKNIQLGFVAIKELFHIYLLPLVLSALLLFLLMPKWSVALGWGLFLAVLFTMGVMGRPGVLRVYMPVASLLLVAPLMVGNLCRKAGGGAMVSHFDALSGLYWKCLCAFS